MNGIKYKAPNKKYLKPGQKAKNTALEMGEHKSKQPKAYGPRVQRIAQLLQYGFPEEEIKEIIKKEFLSYPKEIEFKFAREYIAQLKNSAQNRERGYCGR